MKRSNRLLKRLVKLGATVALLLACSGLKTSAQGNTIVRIDGLGGSTVNLTGLNGAGNVVGYADTAGDASQHPFLYQGGATLDLGTFGGANGYARGLNDLAQVVGTASLTSDAGSHAFLFSQGTLFDLGTLGGSTSSAAAINPSGQIVGESWLAGDMQVHAFRYAGGVMTDLGTLGGSISYCVAINNAGQVSGNATTAGDLDTHAFLFNGGVMTDLGTLGGNASFASAMNNFGQVVGRFTRADGNVHAFLYSNGSMFDLGTLSGANSDAAAITDSGYVVGNSTVAPFESPHGYIYSGGVMTDLGTLGGTYSLAYGVNNGGQVVGEAEDSDFIVHAFLWQNGAMVDLNTLLPANSGWELTTALQINNAGQIAGFGFYQHQYLPYLLTIVPPVVNHPPVANAGADQILECTGAQTLAQLNGGGSSDPDGGTLAYEWSEGGVAFSASANLTVGLTFGMHNLSLKVTDPSGASDVAAVKVTVVDTTPPVVNCPAPTTAPAGANSLTAVPNVLPGVVASDAGTPTANLVMTQSPVAGTLVGLGIHTITVTVADAVGNSSSCTTAFTVADQTPPVVEAPQSARVVANASKQGAVPDLVPQVVASDDVTPSAQLKIVQSPAAGTMLGLGSHLVIFTVTDAAGNQATASTSLEIVEGTPTPHHVCLSVTPHVLRPADRRMVPVRVTVHSRGTVALKCKIVSITSDEPAGSPGHPSELDWVITGDLTAQLRAEASVHGNGRVYTLVVRCTDASGKSSSHKLFVRVPRPCHVHRDNDDKETPKNKPSKN